MGQISLEAKSVDLIGGHLYLVYTDDLGQEWVLRGGPQFEAFGAWGNIVTIAGDLLLAKWISGILSTAAVSAGKLVPRGFVISLLITDLSASRVI